MHLKICAALLLLTPAAFANNVDLKTQLQSCQQISDEEQRLSCFDQIVSRLDAMPVVVREISNDTTKAAELPEVAAAAPVAATAMAPAAPAAQPVSAPAPAAQSAATEFGLTKPEPVAELKEMTAIVKTAKLNKRKKLLITLENGQEWQQIDQDYLNIKSGDTCIIKRGTMGSFLLGVSGYNRTIRVRRVE